uniref:Uncharacterized protein n=1 Tax=Arundo donax TaxID=35708 RepID=A0A0A9DJ44_ARUDO
MNSVVVDLCKLTICELSDICELSGNELSGNEPVGLMQSAGCDHSLSWITQLVGKTTTTRRWLPGRHHRERC